MSKIKDYVINKRSKREKEEWEFLDTLFARYSKKEMRKLLNERKRKNDIF